MIKVLIAEDHAIVRKGLKQLLAETSDLVVSGEAASSQEALAELMKSDYDVVLLDITMPGGGGLSVLNELKSLKPDLAVLVLSMHPEDQYALRVLKAGASGYLTKDSAPEELIEAIRRVSQGGRYISAAVAERLASTLTTDLDNLPHETLSDREYQVMCMIAAGKTVNEIAHELCLSVKTISTYRSRLLEKMRMKSNAELTRYAIQNDLVD